MDVYINNSNAVATLQSLSANSTIHVTGVCNLGSNSFTMPSGCSFVFGSDNDVIKGGTFTGAQVTNSYLNVKKFLGSNGTVNKQSLVNTIALSNNVYISGTCQIDSSVTISRSGVRIYGSLVRGSKLKSTTICNLILVASNVDGFTLENLTLEGISDKYTASYILDVKKRARNIYVGGCVFAHATGGIFVHPQCFNVQIIGCTFKNMVFVPRAQAGSYGVVFHQETIDGISTGVSHGVISGCVFQPTVLRHAVYIQSADDVLISDNVMYGTHEMNPQYIQDAVNSSNYPTMPSSIVDAFDILKHANVAECSINYRGCNNVRILNNYMKGGIDGISGLTDGNNKKGALFLIKENVFEDISGSVPHSGALYINEDHLQDPVIERNVYV